MPFAPSKNFTDRTTAGRELAREVGKLKLQAPLLVLGLPRGGVPVAYEIARVLRAPLDVMVVRKIGMPGHPELAIGAIASGNIIVREPAASLHYGDFDAQFARVAERERIELQRRERVYRPGLPPLELQGQTVVLVDDGLATGATMTAAVRAARKAGASKVIVAAPVASDEAVALVGAEADNLVILYVPPSLISVGSWYANFDQVEDTQVTALLERARRSPLATVPPSPSGT